MAQVNMSLRIDTEPKDALWSLQKAWTVMVPS